MSTIDSPRAEAARPAAASAAGHEPRVRLLEGAALHEAVITDGLLAARDWVWIATADLKDMHVRGARRHVPILEQFDSMAAAGVQFRIVHSALPSRPFRKTLESLPRLTGGGLELQVCPRCHWKLVIVDGCFGYCGSANFTGAGLGARHPDRRNLEMGVVTRDPDTVAEMMRAFDAFWIGSYCEQCRLRARCPDPIR